MIITEDIIWVPWPVIKVLKEMEKNKCREITSGMVDTNT